MIQSNSKFLKSITSADVSLFIVFEQQSIIKLVQKRNYRHTAYYLLDSINNYNWVFWKKHSKVNPLAQLDIVPYNNNTNLHVLTTPLSTDRCIVLYKFFSLISNRYFFFISALEQRIGGLGMLWPSSTFYEREVTELFGIQMSGLLDRRRLLLDYGDFSAPLSADFDINGISELRYSVFTDMPINLNCSLTSI